VGQVNGRFVVQQCGVTCGQCHTVDLQGTANQVHIGFTARGNVQGGGFVAVKQAGIQRCIGVDLHHATFWRGNAAQGTTLGCGWHLLLFVAGGNAAHIGFNPNLKEMRGLSRCVVELAVLHTTARAHALHIARRDALDVAHVVFVGQVAAEHVADDFHVPVTVRAKARARRNAVFVDDAQITPTHELGVVVAGERKAVERLEPAVIGIASVLGFANGQHGVFSYGLNFRPQPHFCDTWDLMASFKLFERLKPDCMTSPRDVLTPDSLSMLHAIEKAGSFAAAARALGLVPSALTYRVRQMEDALDVLLFDRSSRQAKLTAAGHELLREGERLLADMDAIANRVKRVATGWESQFTIAVDGIIDRTTVMELCEAFMTLNAPTRLKLRDETLTGTLEALTSGQADLALGIAGSFSESGTTAGINSHVLGHMRFVFAMAPHHPLAQAPEPLTDALIGQHRAVAVADSVQRGAGVTIGLLPGQDVFTVSNMQSKIEAQLRGLGVGFVPELMVQALVESGRLLVREVDRPQRVAQLSYAWRIPDGSEGERGGRALQWWLKQLKSTTTRSALLVNPRPNFPTRKV